MSKDTTSENLRAELKSWRTPLEEVLNSSADKSKEEVSKLRSKAEQALKESRYRLGETGDALAKQTREALRAQTNMYVIIHGRVWVLAPQWVWCWVSC